MIRKTILTVFAACLVVVSLLTGCSVSPGSVVTRNYAVTGFDGVQAGSNFEVEIIPADTYSVTVMANEGLFKNINVSKSGTTLTLQLIGVNTGFGQMILLAKVGMPELKELKLSGASKATVSGFKSTNGLTLGVSGASKVDMDMETGSFTADLSGASSVNGQLKALEVNVTVSGASRLELAGISGNTSIEASGAGQALLWDATAANVDVNLSGGSRASIYTHGKLNADISGGSTLEYSGNPTFEKVNVTGGATLKPR